MEQNKNPLQNLILREDLNRDILASVLDKFVKLNPDDGQIMLLSDYSKLRNKEQVIVILLAFKALKELGLREKEEISPREVKQVSQLVGSTIRGILRDLVAERTLIYEGGKYKIPNFLLYKIKDKFENLDLETRVKKEKKGVIGKIGKTRKDFSRIKSILEADQKIFDGYLPFLIETQGKYLEKALLILKIAKDEFDIDDLTSAEITEILKNKIRVAGIHQPNISLSLGSTKNFRYVSREPRKEGGYLYKLTRIGEDFVNNLTPKLKEK